jgi:hypothetical protein
VSDNNRSSQLHRSASSRDGETFGPSGRCQLSSSGCCRPWAGVPGAPLFFRRSTSIVSWPTCSAILPLVLSDAYLVEFVCELPVSYFWIHWRIRLRDMLCLRAVSRKPSRSSRTSNTTCRLNSRLSLRCRAVAYSPTNRLGWSNPGPFTCPTVGVHSRRGPFPSIEIKRYEIELTLTDKRRFK